MDPQLRKTLQLVIDGDVVGHETRQKIQKIRPHSPVAVSGQLVSRKIRYSADGAAADYEQPSATSDEPALSILCRTNSAIEKSRTKGPDGMDHEIYIPSLETKINPYVGTVATISRLEMIVELIRPLNHFPEDIIARIDTNLPPEQRHLQLRTSADLRKTLQARSKAQTECRKYLFMKGFDEIETPILFKSTSEGAREFLVPTRQAGLAYSLPQSPQQFKQILMASGISKYFQFARCFRDEDLRADRQPEFTQVSRCPSML